jgi:hypothetical protein
MSMAPSTVGVHKTKHSIPYKMIAQQNDEDGLAITFDV